MRDARNPEWSAFVDIIGDDTSGYEATLPLLVRTAEIASAIEFFFSNIVLNDAEACARRSILCLLNAQVGDISLAVLERVLGKPQTMLSSDLPEIEDAPIAEQ
ncbi:hypothetical protein H4R24_004234 [Coemansia sp. RSA 988]|nr:hypothetical protein H4R24_004234 [Coemansia sp. RSA 988]